MNQNILLKQRTAEIQGQLEAEKAWWDKRRAGIQSDFMKELETDGSGSGNGNGKPVEVAQKKAGSESDDAVLVEAGGPAQVQGGGGAKKKKGKK